MATASTSDASRASSACDLPAAEAHDQSLGGNLQRARCTALLLAALVEAPCPNHRRNDTLEHDSGLGFGLGQRRQVHGLRMSLHLGAGRTAGRVRACRAHARVLLQVCMDAGICKCGLPLTSRRAPRTTALPLTCKIVMPMSVAYMLMHSR